MKKTILLSLSILFIFFSCGQTETRKPADAANDKVKSFADSIHVSLPDNVYRLKDHKIYIDSLRPFFKYIDVERIDLLWKKIKDSISKGLKEITFPDRHIISKVKKDTFHISDYFYIVGNLKKSPGQLDVIIFLDYYECWGIGLTLVSIDDNHEAFDYEPLEYWGGDGGYYSEIEIYYKDFYNYTLKKTNGIYKDAITPGEVMYKRNCYESFTINSNTSFTKKIIHCDSSIIR
jgi:hypothetical protein